MVMTLVISFKLIILIATAKAAHKQKTTAFF